METTQHFDGPYLRCRGRCHRFRLVVVDLMLCLRSLYLLSLCLLSLCLLSLYLLSPYLLSLCLLSLCLLVWKSRVRLYWA